MMLMTLEGGSLIIDIDDIKRGGGSEIADFLMTS